MLKIIYCNYLLLTDLVWLVVHRFVEILDGVGVMKVIVKIIRLFKR